MSENSETLQLNAKKLLDSSLSTLESNIRIIESLEKLIVDEQNVENKKILETSKSELMEATSKLLDVVNDVLGYSKS